MSRWVVLDTETTGLDPRQGHRLVEVGMVEYVKRRRARTWHHYLNPGRDSDPGALAKHGLTTTFLSDKPTFDLLAQDLLDFLMVPQLDALIIHNATFDVGFLDHELGCLGRPALLTQLPKGVLIDSLLLARERFPGKRNTLDALCERFAVDNSARTFHGALLDAELLGEVYLAMTRGQETLEIPVEDGFGLAQEQLEGALNPSRWPLRVVVPNDDELLRHEAHLQGIDKASDGKTVWRTPPVSA